MAEINTQVVTNEFKKIPLWKLVDANYVLPDKDDENFVHRNGFIKKLLASGFAKTTSGPPYDIYTGDAGVLSFIYSSLTAALYDFGGGSGAVRTYSLVTEFDAAQQFKIVAGVIQISIATGETLLDMQMSPSDYTRIDAGAQMALGLKTFENVVVGAQYNNDLCIGYIDTATGSLYADSGEVVSPFFYDTTYTFAQVFGSYARNATRPVYGETRFLIRRIAMTEREVSVLRFRVLSHSCFARLGDDNGSGTSVDWSIIHPLDVCVDFSSTPLIECEFKSTASGAYILIKNSNTFDIFVHSLEIWGLWGVRQSSTGDYGGAIYHASYNENAPSKDNVINIENDYIQTQEQAEEVADFYLDIGTKKRIALTNLQCPHARYLEIGDRLKAQLDDIGSQTGIFIVVGKTIKDGMHILHVKMIGTE